MYEKRRTCHILIISVVLMTSFVTSLFVVKIVSDIKLTTSTNQRVVLPCDTSTDSPVRWCFHRSTEAECDEIAFNGLIVDNHRTAYELDDKQLVVRSAHVDLSGTYMCIEENGQGDRHRINLTFIEQDGALTAVRPVIMDTSTKLHHSENSTSNSAGVSTRIIAVIVVASVALTMLILLLVVIIVKIVKWKRRHDCWKEVKRLQNSVHKQREASDYASGDPLIQKLAQKPGLIEVCATRAANCIRAANLKPDAIVCINGFDCTGSVMFATAVSQRLRLPIIFVAKKDAEPGAVNNIHFNVRYDKKEMVMQIENLDTISDEIHKVVIVDTEIVSGSSMHAAVEKLRRIKRDVLACLVIDDVTTDESRASIQPRILSLFQTKRNTPTETTALTLPVNTPGE